MALPLYIVDAFTREAFRGNPAAVCLLDGPRDPAWMQRVAAEMNQSETAFIAPEHDRRRLRWFTPRAEVDLCGHATLAAAHVLWESGMLSPDLPAIFETRSGRLVCSYRRGGGGWIRMDFPAECPRPMEAGEAAALLAAIGIPVIGAPMRNRMDYLVELGNEQEVRRFAPDLGKLAALPMRGLIVTARPGDAAGAGANGCDFVSRFFAPALGVPEDPVTGSAHCCLGPYWSAKLGKTELAGHQVSERGGVVRLQVKGERVLLSGQALTVSAGQLYAG